MNEEQRYAAVLLRFQEMEIRVDEPIYTLTWQDVARVMVETESFEAIADLPTDGLAQLLNAIQDGLEYLDWYENIHNNLLLAQPDPPPFKEADTEDGHLEAEYEDRVSGADN